LITTGHAFVTENGKMSKTMLGINRDGLIPGLKRLSDTVHAYDCKIMLQLNHSGRQAPEKVIGEKAVAPSAVYHPFIKETPRALEEGEIGELIVSSAYLSPGYWSKDHACVRRLPSARSLQQTEGQQSQQATNDHVHDPADQRRRQRLPRREVKRLSDGDDRANQHP